MKNQWKAGFGQSSQQFVFSIIKPSGNCILISPRGFESLQEVLSQDSTSGTLIQEHSGNTVEMQKVEKPRN